ncbi:MAG: eIF2B alpha/beta/delta subunit family protein [Anaerolineae bacterium]
MAALRWRQKLEALVKDSRLDAQGYLYEVTALLADVIAESVPDSRADYRTWLIRRVKSFVAAGRERASVFRLANGLLWAVDESTSAGDMRARALWHLQGFGERRAAILTELVAAAARELSRYRTVMTYGRDPELLASLSRAAETRDAPAVMLGEGRPRFEGTAMASELAWAGIDVTLGVDMALFGWLQDVEAVVFGAESLSSRGLVHKLGTAALASAAQAREIPVFVICAQADFIPAEYLSGADARPGDPNDIAPDAHERVTVRNIKWDLTPLDQITAVISGQGMLTGNALAEALSAVQVYPGLVGR